MSSEGLSASVVPTAPGAPSGQSRTDFGGSADHIVAGTMQSKKTSTLRRQSVFIFEHSPRLNLLRQLVGVVDGITRTDSQPSALNSCHQLLDLRLEISGQRQERQPRRTAVVAVEIHGVLRAGHAE